MEVWNTTGPESTRRRAAKKAVLPTEVAVLQPDVAQQAVCDPGQHHDRLHVVGHFYKGQEKGQQVQGDYRARSRQNSIYSARRPAPWQSPARDCRSHKFLPEYSGNTMCWESQSVSDPARYPPLIFIRVRRTGITVSINGNKIFPLLFIFLIAGTP